MAVTEFEIVLKSGWNGASLRSVVESIDTGQIRSVALICEDQVFPDGDWAELVTLFEAWQQLTQVSFRLLSDFSESDTHPPQPIIEQCRKAGVSLSVDIAIQDTADVPACLLGRDNSLATVVKISERLIGDGLHVRWLIPVTSQLVYRLDGLVSLSYDTQAEPVLMLPDALENKSQLSDAERLFASDFVAYRMLGEEAGHLSQDNISYYQHLSHVFRLNTHEGHDPSVGVLSPDPEHPGRWRIEQSGCSDGKLRTQGLRHTSGGGNGYSRLTRIMNLAGDVADVLSGGMRAHLQTSLAQFSRSNRSSAARADAPLNHVLLIGAYGGEHIGDLAILGGVLRRIHDRHGTTSAVLMSQRPDHTRHLMPMLDADVSLEVMEYTFSNIDAAVAKADGVVYAGGPLTDIPKQLVRHLYAASLARRADKPFIIEGIGPGVFKRKPSMITAKRLVSLADRISIRTSDDARRDVIHGLSVEIGQDPAFDYLETRAEILTRLPDFEKEQIDELLKGAEDRPLVGLNVRPIGDFFTPDAPGRDRAAYTREVEQNFERQFASGLQKFAAQAPTKPCFVFFPMNAIQFGMSDLRSAYRIMTHLDPGIDFRVWQADASLDGVVALIRRLDLVVSMRFHATIFALSQGCNAIGIDYRIGKKDKVASVMSDAGKGEDCCRIDQLTADWLCGKISDLSG